MVKFLQVRINKIMLLVGAISALIIVWGGVFYLQQKNHTTGVFQEQSMLPAVKDAEPRSNLEILESEEFRSASIKEGSLAAVNVEKQNYISNESVLYSIENTSDYSLWFLPYRFSVNFHGYSKFLRQDNSKWINVPSNEIVVPEVTPNVSLVEIKPQQKFREAIPLNQLALSGTYKVVVFYTFSGSDLESFLKDPYAAYSNSFDVKKDVEWHSACLEDSEIAKKTLDAEYYSHAQIRGPLLIEIRNSLRDQIVASFPVTDVNDGIQYMTQFRKCGVYVIREFNRDNRKSEQAPGFELSLWKFSYDGRSEQKLVYYQVTDSERKSNFEYNQRFDVDPTERYIVLSRGYLGGKNAPHEVIIKDLQTQSDVFKLNDADILSRYPFAEGEIILDHWSVDGNYFYGRTVFAGHHEEDKVLSLFKIESETWKTEFYKFGEEPSNFYDTSE